VAFVVAGFVQLAIDADLTPIPDYKTQNSMRVLNGLSDEDFTAKSDYWNFVESYNATNGYLVNADTEQFRTETHALIRLEI
jgi:hypothetical protein